MYNCQTPPGQINCGKTNFVGSEIVMSKQSIFRVSALSLIIVLLGLSTIHSAGAQDPPRPPEPKQTPQREDARDKKGERRQGAKADERTLNRDEVFNIDTDLVLLDVTVIDQNNTPIMNLKKEDFSVYEDRVKQTVDNVSREEVPISFGLVIDTSGSMRTKLQTVSDASVS